MNTRAIGALFLRILGFWLLLEAAFGVIGVVFIHQELGLGVHRRYYDGALSTPSLSASPNYYLHDTFYVISNFAPVLVCVGLRVAAGLFLMLKAKTVARLFCRNLEE